METYLEGRLAKVRIIGITDTGTPYGYPKEYPQFKEKVFVLGAGNHLKEFCFVRFNLLAKTPEKPPFGNFIAPNAPKEFEFYNPEEYILYGFWDKNWESKRPIPLLDKINEYYSPGNSNKVIFCKENGAKFLIYRNNCLECNLSYNEIIPDEMPNPKRNSRMIIVSDEEGEYSILKQAERKGLKAVKMESLK